MISLFTIHFTTQATVVVLSVCSTICYLAWISLRIQLSKERAVDKSV
jgi:hypothetical protein